MNKTTARFLENKHKQQVSVIADNGAKHFDQIQCDTLYYISTIYCTKPIMNHFHQTYLDKYPAGNQDSLDYKKAGCH